MYKVDSERIMFENNRLFALLPIIDFGSSCGVYKVRIDKDVYAIISTKAIATTLSAQSFFDILNISIYCGRKFVVNNTYC